MELMLEDSRISPVEHGREDAKSDHADDREPPAAIAAEVFETHFLLIDYKFKIK